MKLSKTYLKAFALSMLAAACTDPACPDGFYKMGDVCRRADTSVGAAEKGDDLDAAVPDGFSPTTKEGGDAGSGGADIEGGNAASNPSADECDDASACGIGLICDEGSCVSACAQKDCGPDAECSVIGGTPLCSCKGGFVATQDTTTDEARCVQDASCECDTNAICQVDASQIHHCKCKPGYTGDGASCSPVRCPPVGSPNGQVSTSDGKGNFDSTATFTCNPGFEFANGAPSVTRACGADGTWGSDVPQCVRKDCGPPEVPRFPDNSASGSVVTPQGTAFGAIADYQCRAGLSLVGSARRQCEAGGWSGEVPRCQGCGDQLFTPGSEECDPTAPEWDKWSCGADCKKKTLYGRCTSDADCSGEEFCQLGIGCTIRCDAARPCPKAPSGNARCPVTGSGSAEYCVVEDCSSSDDCPAGLACSASLGAHVCGACFVAMDLCGDQQTCKPMTSGMSIGWCEPS